MMMTEEGSDSGTKIELYSSQWLVNETRLEFDLNRSAMLEKGLNSRLVA